MNAALKVDPSRLPVPRLEPTRSYHTPPDFPEVIEYLTRHEEAARRHPESRKRCPGEWTDEEKDTLVGMYQQGKTYSEIAEALGRSEKACRSMMGKTGSTRKRRQTTWTKERTDELMTMIRNGHSRKEAAARLGVNVSSVHKKLERIRRNA